MSDDVFYDDYGNGIDDQTWRVFETEGEAEEFASFHRGYYEARYNDYGEIEYIVFYRING